jgi:nuclear GTP-binding protein
MYSTRPVRNKRGRVMHEAFQSKALPSTRIQPDRRWFGNTRVVGARQLEQFRDEMAAKVDDTYAVLLRQKKLPLSLLQEPAVKGARGKAASGLGPAGAAAAAGSRAALLATQPYAKTFGRKADRKRPRVAAESYDELVEAAARQAGTYQTRHGDGDGDVAFEGGGAETVTIVRAAEARDAPLPAAFGAAAAASALAVSSGARPAARDPAFDKGQSKRIWGELYKVLDSSDVVVQVLDARDPAGTRCRFLEQHLRANARHKHLILLLNKVDLVSFSPSPFLSTPSYPPFTTPKDDSQHLSVPSDTVS